ncbi:MAG: GatB/YqeY domain-containing protein [Bacilli bacterium]|nr:GatB/YqeY domain-containing protein [Bacilli bacterium]
MIIDEIKKANVEAMKAHDNIARGVLSIVMTKYKLQEVELKAQNKEIGDSDLLSIIQKTLKELSDEKEGYKQVNNLERVNDLTRQESVLNAYLPKQLSEQEIRDEIAKLEDKSIPSVMKHFKTNFAGKVDMSLVNKLAREL